MVGKTVENPRRIQVNVPLSDREEAVLGELAAKSGMSRQAIIRTALRYYQLLDANPDAMASVRKLVMPDLGPKAAP